MVFPLLKTWLRPLLGSSARGTDKQYKTPEGFRSIGGRGADDSRSGRRGTANGPRTANPLTNVTITESEERIVNEIKLQNVKAGAISTPQANQGDVRGIVVMTEFDISEDRSSQHGHHPTRAHEPW
jgi:hypothetical protein